MKKMEYAKLKKFYKNKKVFVSGHTGFKGSWLCFVLLSMGAEITGYALEPEGEKSLFHLTGLGENINSVYGDIRDLEKIKRAFRESKADIAFHLAAQPLVKESYMNPQYTYEVNVMGTVNFLEAARNTDTVKSIVNITTDKVYENTETWEGYKETDRLDGYDPYANSKSCSELITASYRRSFFSQMKNTAVSTVRAGNVIGGGDFAKDRIIPDCIRTALGQTENPKIVVRNPNSVRPYQHVLEPVSAYLMLAGKQYEDITYEGAYNIGPGEKDCITTGELVSLFCEKWGEGLKWESLENIRETKDKTVHEATLLKLDSSKISEKIGYEPQWDIENAIDKAVEWAKCYKHSPERENIQKCMKNQIEGFINHK